MICALVAVVVALASAWAFGSVEPLWWCLASVGILVPAVVALGGCLLREERPDRLRLPSQVPRLALLLPLVALIGLVPLPPSVLNVLQPGSASLLAEVSPELASGWRPLTLDPRATAHAVLVAASVGALLWTVSRAALDPRGARILTAVALVGFALLAAFGLIQNLTLKDPQRIYWTIPLAEVGTPFGPYVNRNHFAGAMELAAGLAAGSFVFALAAGRRFVAVLVGALLLLFLVALFATTSRGGVLGAGVGGVAFVLAASRSQRMRAVLSALVVCGLVLAGLAATGLLGEWVSRFVADPLRNHWESRFLAQLDGVRVFLGHPLTGTGAGSFESVFPPFQTVSDARHFGNAHSDWAQFLMELGLVGVAFTVVAVRHVGGVLTRGGRADDPARWLVLGPACGCLALTVHGLFEVNLHVPSNALMFALVLSLAYAAAVRLTSRSDPGTDAQAGGTPAGTSTGSPMS